MDATDHALPVGEADANDATRGGRETEDGPIDDAPLLASKKLQQLMQRGDPRPHLTHSDELQRYVKENLKAAEGDGGVQVVTDEIEIPSVGEGEVVGGDGSIYFGEQVARIPSVSSDAGNLSELSSDGGSEFTDNTKSKSPDIRYTPPETSSARFPTAEEFNRELKSDLKEQGHLSVPKTQRSPGASRRPAIASWRGPAPRKSDIPPKVPSFARSDTSDLGDREFHANFRATGRKSTFPIDTGEATESLSATFFDSLVMTSAEKRGFIPRALLYNIVNVDCVFNELCKFMAPSLSPAEIWDLAGRICGEEPQPQDADEPRPPRIKSFKKVFVTLVFCGLTARIVDFLDEVNDLDLPLVKANKSTNGARFQLRKHRAEDKPLSCFKSWDFTELFRFEEWQWATVSPFFYKGTRKYVPHFPLQDSIILPYTYDSRRDTPDMEGGFGNVFKVKIHEEHHNFTPIEPSKQLFAVKHLKSRDKEVFEKEVLMLRMFSDDAHPHLISLLATYEQYGTFYLVFPCAEGNLSEFWEKFRPQPKLNMTTVRWVAKQCEGLADGLVQIHHYLTSNFDRTSGPPPRKYIWHGDLKPENVLYFPDSNGGLLKISDFGLAHSSSRSKSYKPGSKVPASMIYRPPECDLKEGVVGQSYDIWTLGCLYLEFITWMLGGWKLVKEFSRKRLSMDPMWYMPTDTFFKLERGREEAMVKPAVLRFIEEDLCSHEMCPEFVHEFINLIEYDMLVVKSSDASERGRLESKEVHKKLKNMLRRCENQDYACKPAPWTRKRALSHTHNNRAVTAESAVQATGRFCSPAAHHRDARRSSHEQRGGGHPLALPFLPLVRDRSSGQHDLGPLQQLQSRFQSQR